MIFFFNFDIRFNKRVYLKTIRTHSVLLSTVAEWREQNGGKFSFWTMYVRL